MGSRFVQAPQCAVSGSAEEPPSTALLFCLGESDAFEELTIGSKYASCARNPRDTHKDRKMEGSLSKTALKIDDVERYPIYSFFGGC